MFSCQKVSINETKSGKKYDTNCHKICIHAKKYAYTQKNMHTRKKICIHAKKYAHAKNMYAQKITRTKKLDIQKNWTYKKIRHTKKFDYKKF